MSNQLNPTRELPLFKGDGTINYADLFNRISAAAKKGQVYVQVSLLKVIRKHCGKGMSYEHKNQLILLCPAILSPHDGNFEGMSIGLEVMLDWKENDSDYAMLSWHSTSDNIFPCKSASLPTEGGTIFCLEKPEHND